MISRAYLKKTFLKELQELKRQIITSIKMNKNLEQDLDMMDVKIGLLVKNRITLQVS